MSEGKQIDPGMIREVMRELGRRGKGAAKSRGSEQMRKIGKLGGLASAEKRRVKNGQKSI